MEEELKINQLLEGEEKGYDQFKSDVFLTQGTHTLPLFFKEQTGPEDSDTQIINTLASLESRYILERFTTWVPDRCS